ncbi:hypothetical protein MRX96_051638 [Rhipicephalus microplus]
MRIANFSGISLSINDSASSNPRLCRATFTEVNQVQHVTAWLSSPRSRKFWSRKPLADEAQGRLPPPRGTFRARLRRGRGTHISTSCLSGRNIRAKLMKEVRMEEPCFQAHLHRSRGTRISTSWRSGRNSPCQAYEGVKDGEACFTGWTRVDVPAANGEVAVVFTTLSWYGIRQQGQYQPGAYRGTRWRQVLQRKAVAPHHSDHRGQLWW